MLHTLLLNSTYECIAFISERKVFKLLAKEKIEVLTEWDSKITFWDKQKINHPAVVRLRYHVRWIPRKIRYNNTAVFRRDHHKCQFCNKTLTSTKLTIDHIIPRSKGGESSWSNCVTSCFDCNNTKSNRTPEEAGMKLLRKPTAPIQSIYSEYCIMKNTHPSWADYVISPK